MALAYPSAMEHEGEPVRVRVAHSGHGDGEGGDGEGGGGGGGAGDDDDSDSDSDSDSSATIALFANEHKRDICTYEEGFGGSRGLARSYWLQRFCEEKMYLKGQELAATKEHGAKFKKVKIWRTPDNLPAMCNNLRLREFFNLGGYHAFRDVVMVEVLVRELLSVDTSRGEFRVSMIIALR